MASFPRVSSFTGFREKFSENRNDAALLNYIGTCADKEEDMSSYKEGQINQLANALEAADYTPEDVTSLGQGDLISIRSFVRGQARIVPIEPPEPLPILKLISGGQGLVIGACDGKRIIAKAKEVFRSGIDSDFERWRANEPGQPTPKTVPDVHEMVKDATFSQMFGFLGADIDDVGSMRKYCFTQHQIIDFVEKYPDWLRADGYATFFLFQSHDEFFVAGVCVSSDGLFVRVSRFEDGHVWRAGRRRRVVVPRLA